MVSSNTTLDDLVASFSICMNENFQMDGMMSVISGIKNRGLSSTSVGNLAPTADIPELDDSEWRMDREWTAVVVEEDDCSWRKEEEEDEFAAYSPAQQKILRQAKSTFKRLDAVCFEAGKALAWYSVMHSNLVEFFTTLVDTHDTWTDIYEVSHHHLEPERPAAQALQQAIRRLADLERWRRIATAWVLDACHKLDPFYNRLKEMVLQQQIKMEALKNLYSQECDLDDPSDVLTYGLESLTLEIEENVQFPKVPKIPAPYGAQGSIYLDWPKEERLLVEKALDILDDADFTAKLWKMY